MAPVSIVQLALVTIIVLSSLVLAFYQWQESQALKELEQQFKEIDLGDHEQFSRFTNLRMRIINSWSDKQKSLQTAILVCMALLLIITITPIILKR